MKKLTAIEICLELANKYPWDTWEYGAKCTYCKAVTSNRSLRHKRGCLWVACNRISREERRKA